MARRAAERQFHIELAQRGGHGIGDRDPATVAASLRNLATAWRERSKGLGPSNHERTTMRAAAEQCTKWARAIEDAIEAGLPAPNIIDLPEPGEFRGRRPAVTLPVPETASA